MFRFLGIGLFLTTLIVSLGVVERTRAEKVTECTLALELPLSAPPPVTARDRVARLEIDGKDYGTPRDGRRNISIPLKEGADTVTVVYTFWPTTYTRIIRTQVVKVSRGKIIKVSLMKAGTDPADKIWVIYVPTPNEVVDAMCRLAKIGKDDVVYDIGCGDGRLVIHAVKKYEAKKGIGIDLLPERIKECRANALAAEVEDKVTFEEKDALKIKDFSEASVVLIYLSNPLNEALRPTLRKTLKPGSRIVSHRFLMGDWKPDKTETMKARNNQGKLTEFKLHLWTIKP